jgi:hypothetical protein
MDALRRGDLGECGERDGDVAVLGRRLSMKKFEGRSASWSLPSSVESAVRADLWLSMTFDRWLSVTAAVPTKTLGGRMGSGDA